MSDTEEVFITKSAKSQSQKDTKPHIAREKLKEKRERLKKEKENTLIEEAKKRLLEEQTKKQQEEQLAKQQSEEKKKNDPTFALLMKMEEMMAKMNGPKEVPKKTRTKKVVEPEPEPEVKPKRQYKKKQLTKEEEDEAHEEIIIRAKPAPKPRQKTLPKPKKKVVYLEPDVRDAPDTQFVGYDIAPPAEPIQYNQPSSLMSAMMNRRNMNGNMYF